MLVNSSFALKNNVAEIKKKVYDINVAKINSIDELQGKNYVKDSYLYLNQEYEYFGIDKVNPHKLFCPGNQQELVIKN